jgi:hypothetical protein
MLAGPMTASAGNRVTFGDVSASFQALANGCSLSEQGIPAAPADGNSRGRLSRVLSDGQSYCENDWILVSLVLFYPKGTGADQVRRKEAVEILSETSVEHEVDGNALSEITTPLKVGRQVVPGFFERLVWWQNWGTCLAPHSLYVGEHQLSTLLVQQGLAPNLGDTFYILSAEDPYCTE